MVKLLSSCAVSKNFKILKYLNFIKS